MRISSFLSKRLSGELLSIEHAAFIQELLNTNGWIKFIGDRCIHSIDDAEKYIQRINSNKGFHYWVIRKKATKEPIGIITFLQRDYLDYPDIGFAFLPTHQGNGYAYEITNELISRLFEDENCTILLGITLPANTASIRLLEKLQFQLEKEFMRDNETLLKYIRKNSHKN
jgi:[ribosomal protein S5]-alanine N-acetyltransferase